MTGNRAPQRETTRAAPAASVFRRILSGKEAMV